MSGLKSAWKLELSFSSTLYFIFIACVLLEIDRDKLGPIDCDRVLGIVDTSKKNHKSNKLEASMLKSKNGVTLFVNYSYNSLYDIRSSQKYM